MSAILGEQQPVSSGHSHYKKAPDWPGLSVADYFDF
jgi:hypothetical protein